LNQRSSELPLDLVILLDTFPSVLLANLTRLGANVARAYLRNFDRVGLVIFGGTIGWIPPASGHFQERVIAERLLQVRAYQTDADKRIDLIPRSALPRQAAVIVISALGDRRIIRAITDLKFAGHQVIVIGPVSPSRSGARGDGEIGCRLSALIRRQLIEDISRLDVSVIDTSASHDAGPEKNGYAT
jgi:uncharacterized protein (DUF58 family)